MVAQKVHSDFSHNILTSKPKQTFWPTQYIQIEISTKGEFKNINLAGRYSYRLEMGVSGNLWIVVKDVKTLVVYDVEGGTVWIQ